MFATHVGCLIADFGCFWGTAVFRCYESTIFSWGIIPRVRLRPPSSNLFMSSDLGYHQNLHHSGDLKKKVLWFLKFLAIRCPSFWKFGVVYCFLGLYLSLQYWSTILFSCNRVQPSRFDGVGNGDFQVWPGHLWAWNSQTFLGPLGDPMISLNPLALPELHLTNIWHIKVL